MVGISKPEPGIGRVLSNVAAELSDLTPRGGVHAIIEALESIRFPHTPRARSTRDIRPFIDIAKRREGWVKLVGAAARREKT